MCVEGHASGRARQTSSCVLNVRGKMTTSWNIEIVGQVYNMSFYKWIPDSSITKNATYWYRATTLLFRIRTTTGLLRVGNIRPRPEKTRRKPPRIHIMVNKNVSKEGVTCELEIPDRRVRLFHVFII